jgi:hypothetical protein
VPWIEVSDEQILKSLDSLSPEGRRQAVLRLIAGANVLDRTIDKFQPRLIELVEERGLNWAQLSDEERERLVDDILHE